MVIDYASNTTLIIKMNLFSRHKKRDIRVHVKAILSHNIPMAAENHNVLILHYKASYPLKQVYY